MINVCDLEAFLSSLAGESVITALGDVIVNDDASVLQAGDQTWLLDEIAITAWCRFLKIPARYVNGLDPEFRSSLLRYELEKNASVEAAVEMANSSIVAVHSPSQLVLPPLGVAGVVSRVFDPGDCVNRVLYSDDLLHIDVTTPAQNVNLGTVPSWTGETIHNDIVDAGVRFVSNRFRSRPPVVSFYAERLVCTNGMTRTESAGKISLRGRTVDEVLVEMEAAARLVLEQAPQHLANLLATRSTLVPGVPQAFAAQVARECGVTAAVLHEVLDGVNQLTAPVTVWDIQNVFTEVANGVLNYSTLVKLQELGGLLAFDAESQVARCVSCEKKL